jgi:SAM-dependent methyltransferase
MRTHHPIPPSLPSLGYDAVPYPARAFPTTHPEHLATVLTLLGLRAPQVETCRVLEIGCATGGNLLPMADGLHGARFVGIDLSRVQIEAARAAVRKLGLENVELRCQDLCDFDRPGTPSAAGGPVLSPSKGPGKRPAKSAPPAGPELFDYIIAHGLYSWVPPGIRDKLLALCAAHLAPGGVAFISYNTLPGWHVQSAIRELMLAHVWGQGVGPGMAPPATPPEVAAKAREVIEFLSAADPAGAPFAALLKETASRLRALPDANLLHDHLCPINEPVYFSQFAAECTAKGLRYLGDAHTQSPNPPDTTELTVSPREKLAPTLPQIAPLPAHMELFLDVWGNRPFRQSLLCRTDAPPAPLDGPIGPPSTTPFAANAGYMQGLFVGSSLKPTSLAEPEFGTPVPETFINPRGITATVAEPLTRSAMLCLADAWPARLPYDGLLKAAWSRMGLAGGSSDTGAARLAAALLQGHISGLIELSIRPARCATRLTRRPIARPLARLQAETDDTVTTLRHDNLRLNATARSLLRLLDGSRDLPALCSAMEQIMLENARNMDPSLTLTDADRKHVSKGLEQDLRRFVDEGLLVG